MDRHGSLNVCCSGAVVLIQAFKALTARLKHRSAINRLISAGDLNPTASTAKGWRQCIYEAAMVAPTAV